MPGAYIQRLAYNDYQSYWDVIAMADNMDISYAHNLLPNPKPTDTSAWKFYSLKDLRVQMLSDNRLHITNNANIPDSYIYTQLQLPAGVYRFGAEVSSPQGAYASNLLRMVIMPRTELASATWDGTPGRVVTPANTVPEDSTVEFRVMVGPNANCAIWVRQLFVMSEEDYQHMISDGITWFDGDGIVAGLPLSTFRPHVDMRVLVVVA